MVVRGIKHMDITNYIYQAEKLGVFSSQELKNIIRMTPNNLEFMRETYPDQNSHFIRKNIEKYVEIMDDALLSREELLEILSNRLKRNHPIQ